MAISIDDVYQKVLVLANKEQRGYITPQEFDLFADQAQMEIFEQYFYDKNQFTRIPGNRHAYSDPITNLEQKIAVFEHYNTNVDVTHSNSNPNNNPGFIGSWGDVDLGEQLPDIYRLGLVTVRYHTESRARVAERFETNEIHEYAQGLLTRPTKKNQRV